MGAIPHRVGLYLAVLQLFFTLCWTVYAIYLPKLTALVGIPASMVIWILLLDQAVFTVTDTAMGVAADKVSNVLGRLGRLVAAITALSCAAFLLLPLVAAGTGSAPLFMALTLVWVVTSSALRAPPLMLLGKYAAAPSIPWLSSLSMLGIGIASAVSPYLARTLRELDPRIPFALASLVLVVTALALSTIERNLARDGGRPATPPPRPPAVLSPPVVIFIAAMAVLALGFQLHFALNSAPLFRRLAPDTDLSLLMPVFWVGFNVALLPASFLTKRWGALPVIGISGLAGALAIAVVQLADILDVVLVAQFAAGAAWACVMMSAVTAALSIGNSGAEGRVVGLMFSALAVATFLRMASVAGGLPGNPAIAEILEWAPIFCWAIAGAVLIYISATRMRSWMAAR